MDRIFRKFQLPPYDGTYQEHLLYRREEADKFNIKYRKEWWMANDQDWVLTEDDWVGQLIRRQVFEATIGTTTVGWMLTFSFCRAIIKFNRIGERIDKKQLLYDPYRVLGAGYRYHRAQTWDEAVMRSQRGKNTIEKYVELVLARRANKERLTKDDWLAIAFEYRPNEKMPLIAIKKLFKSRLVRHVAKERCADVLRERGVTYHNIIGHYEDARDLALSQGDISNYIRANDRIAAMKKEFADDGHEVEWTPTTGDEVKLQKVHVRPQLPKPRPKENVSNSADSL